MTTEKIPFLSLPENRAAAKTISLRVLARVRPEEAEDSAGLIEPLLDMIMDEVVLADGPDDAGGFGGTGLMVLVVTPTVSAALDHLLTRLGEASIAALKKRRREQPASTPVTITVDDVQPLIARTRSPRGVRTIKTLLPAINAAIRDYLEDA